MNFEINPGTACGQVLVPASKSHTIRALFFAALSHGRSVVHNPLDSADGRSALEAISALGATYDLGVNSYIINGVGGDIKAPADPVDVGNSGTTARFLVSLAALGDEPITITGDESTRSRPMGPLLDALRNLGAKTSSSNGKLPATIQGPLLGGETKVDGTTSQYLSSLLIHAPLAPNDTVITLNHLNEQPYIDMTLRWLDRFAIKYSREAYDRFEIFGGQRYEPFETEVPGDFSSATFFACLGAMPGNRISITGLDLGDSQGDKAVFSYVEKMGATVVLSDGKITVMGDDLHGAELDLNATPDALPAMAALAAHAVGETRLVNVPQARIKETDRIAVMAEELGKMGVVCKELPDGLVIQGGKVTGATVKSHGDHRLVMSLAVAASAAVGQTIIEDAEVVDVTFPTFANLMASCGVDIKGISKNCFRWRK